MSESIKMATDEKKKQSKQTQEKEIEQSAATDDISSELREPRWSVISFEKCEANNLSYDKAVEKLKELEAAKVSGLCIVTDEAAARVS